MPSTSPLKLSVDRQGKTLIGKLGFASNLPDQFQSNEVDLEIEVCDPAGFTSAPNPLDMAAFGMRVSVGDTPTGAAGGPTPLALGILTWNAAGASPPSRFVGTLALNTGAIDTFIGSAPSKTAYFEINLTILGTRKTIFQSTFTIKAVVDEGTSTVPTPTDSYMTKNEILQTFVKKVMTAGETIQATSPDGTSYGIEFAVSDDGSVQLNSIKL